MYKHELLILEQSTCDDNIIYWILKGKGYEYQLFNLKLFSPHFIHSSLKDLNGISRPFENNEILSVIFNTNIEKIMTNKIKDINSYIKDNIKYFPVCFWIDAYYCDWTPFYNSVHFSHYMQIVELDDVNMMYNCLDIYYPSKGIIKLKYEFISNKASWIECIHLGKKLDDACAKAIHYLQKSIKNINLKKYDEEKIELMSKIISFSSSKYLNHAELESSILILTLKWISEDKLNFIKGLKYLDSKLSYPLFNDLNLHLMIASEETVKLKNIIIKYLMTNFINLEKTSKIIDKIYKENYIANQLLNSKLRIATMERLI